MSQIVKLPEGTRGEVLRFSTVPDVPLLQSICPKNTLRNVGIKCLKKCWDKVSKCTRTTMILIINIIRETIWTMTMIIRRITIIIIIIINHHHHHKKKWFNIYHCGQRRSPIIVENQRGVSAEEFILPKPVKFWCRWREGNPREPNSLCWGCFNLWGSFHPSWSTINLWCVKIIDIVHFNHLFIM